MRYSLSSRFRGTFIGAALGDFQSKRSSQQLDSCGKMAVLGAKSLIDLGRFQLEDWQTRFSPHSPEQDAVSRVPMKAIVATLPLALFYHESEIKLRQNLLSLIEIWQDDSELRDGALAVGYVIAQSLREKLDPVQLIPQTLTFLERGNLPASSLINQLAQVQSLLEQGADLQSVMAQLSRNLQSSTSIALAFYCFLSTPEDFRLSVLRAIQTESQQMFRALQVPLLTGALSGAFNSITGIPVSWRITALYKPAVQPLADWGIKTEAEMLVLCDLLLAIWSGVYDPATVTQMIPIPAIAAPRVIRLR